MTRRALIDSLLSGDSQAFARALLDWIPREIDFSGGSDGNVLTVQADGSLAIEALPAPTVLTATATLDFPSIPAQDSAELTMTVTGAAVGDAVALGLPNPPAADVVFIGYVSATDTVTIRAVNATGAAIDPASGTFRAAVFRF